MHLCYKRTLYVLPNEPALRFDGPLSLFPRVFGRVRNDVCAYSRHCPTHEAFLRLMPHTLTLSCFLFAILPCHEPNWQPLQTILHKSRCTGVLPSCKGYVSCHVRLLSYMVILYHLDEIYIHPTSLPWLCIMFTNTPTLTTSTATTA